MKILFSSWNDEIIDNRGIDPVNWKDAPQVKLPTEFDKENNVIAFIGWAGIILVKNSVNIVDMCASFFDYVQNNSCGKCFAGRIGTAVMQKFLKKIAKGDGEESDLTHLEALGKNILKTAKCSVGQTSPIPILHALKFFREDFLTAVRVSKPVSNTTRYEGKWTIPCYYACPTGMDIATYIELIKEWKPLESLRVIREASPMASTLGRACFHPCEDNCRRKNVEKSISICKLKRFAWDYEDLHSISKPTNPNKHVKEDKITVIGTGPAGLSAAYYLALRGYRVTVFESLPVHGGMVGVGIPSYRVPKEILQKEVNFIEDMGVEIRYNTKVGKDITIPQLKEQGYKAFYISTGAHLSKKMGAEGEDAGYDGFIKGVDYLRDCVTTKCYTVKGKRVIVVGGGNVAMDCCRTPVRLGAEEVIVVYRRTKKELPADPHEVYESEIEGVQYTFLTAPKRIIAENGKVTGLECLKMELGEPDASGRRRPIEVKGSEFVIPADIVIQAIGQDCDLSVLNGVNGIKLTKWQTIVADPHTFQTDVPWIFTGGDVFNGPLTIVDACGNARRAAESIDQYLSNKPVSLSVPQKIDKVIKVLGAYNKYEKIGIKSGWERVPMPTIPMDERLNSFEEVETGYSLEQAIEEASRCMRCYQIAMVALEQTV
ncbi:MAG: FAD-dependent oxidoreductase [Nitrospinae bacterium]|nr:FAD-dependent oxidoreductase [Nitrospinota bacterium]